MCGLFNCGRADNRGCGCCIPCCCCGRRRRRRRDGVEDDFLLDDIEG